MECYRYTELIGKTIKEIKLNKSYPHADYEDELIITLDDDNKYMFWHDQDCCESVYIYDIIGDFNDLIGSPIIIAEEVTYDDVNPEGTNLEGYDSFTWTFYKFSTNRGSVTIRWYGESNGYYSERVDFKEL